MVNIKTKVRSGDTFPFLFCPYAKFTRAIMRRIELYGSRLAVRKTLIPIIKVSVRRNSRSWVLNDAYIHPKMN